MGGRGKAILLLSVGSCSRSLANGLDLLNITTAGQDMATALVCDRGDHRLGGAGRRA